ncbi:MAG: amino acid permease [Methanobacteriota archaeon]
MQKLKRELGLLEVTLSGVGIILGAGIYALVGKAAGLAGNALWISFIAAALIAALTGLSYAELSSIYPKAGAEYEYIRNAFGKKPAFLVAWLIIFSGIIGASTVALGFGGYFSALFGGSPISAAVLLLAAFSLVLFRGIKESAWLAIVFTLVEVGGLVIVILIGFPHLGSVSYFEAPAGAGGIFQAAALIFFAFIGFEEIVRLSEETKNPERVIPLGLLLSIGITIVLYILVAVSCVSVLGWMALLESDAPLADVASVAFGERAFLVLSLIALCATSNTVLLILLGTSRIIFGMAGSGSLPSMLSKVHYRRGTPYAAIVFMTVSSAIFALIGEIEVVANATNFMVFVTFAIVNLSLITLRYKKPELQRRFRTPLNIGRFPVLSFLGAVSCILMLFNLDIEAVAIGIALLALGFLAMAALKI